MRLRRSTGYFVLFLISAIILSACGGGGGGDSAPPAPLAPTVTTSSVNSPSVDNALINGSVNPNGLATTAWFEYGTDASLPTFTKTADQAIATGTVPLSINATLLNLSAGTKYYYRAAASSTAGTSKGAIDNLTTLSLPPTVTTTVADNITISAAVLRGDVNPNGLATTAWFEYGLNSSLSPPVTKTTDQVLGSGKTPVSISQSIPGLQAGSTYYFRVAASNAGGPSTGGIKFFVTSANPPPVANAGADNSVIMGQSVTLNGSGSSDGGNGGTITYQWTQVGGTAATLSGATTPSPTFTAPTVSYPGDNLVFQLTVTSSRGPSASDNVLVTDKWGFLDNFSTNTIGEYAVLLDGAAASFTYDLVGQRARILSGDDNGVTFTHGLPESNQGAFSIDFNPTVKYPTGGGVWVRLMQNDNNTCYEIRNFDWDDPSGHTQASVRKIVAGSVVEEKLISAVYAQGGSYNIKITFSPSLMTMNAFGEIISLNADATGISVNKFQVETRQQAAYFDNIKLEPKP